MPHVALNWDSHCIRLAVATLGKTGVGRVRFDRAVTIQLGNAADSGASGEKLPELSTSRLADKLAAILERYRISRGEATVVLARSDVEMRELELPNVPAEELPDLVRFQARNHFTSFTDEWLLDYVRICQSEQGCTVLAMAISGEQARKIRETVELAGLRLRHIVLRPFAAAELLRSHQPCPNCRVVLEPLWRQADISVVRNDYVVLTRTVRVPDTYSDEQFDAWLPDEIRRTIAAASNQTSAEHVDEIIVCGSESLHQKLREELSQKIQIPTTFFDPFDAVTSGAEFEKPDRIDGFASLLGSILQSTGHENHAVDLLNPRQAPQPELDKRKLAIAGGIAAGILVLGAVWYWWVLSSRNAEIARLIDQNAGILVQVEEVEEVAKRVAPIDNWRKGGIDWLEILYQLSLAYPDPDLARLRQLSGTVKVNNASVDVKGVVRDQLVLGELSQRLLEGPFVDVNVPRKFPTNDPEFTVGMDQSILVPLFDVNSIGRPPAPLPADDSAAGTNPQPIPTNSTEVPTDVE